MKKVKTYPTLDVSATNLRCIKALLKSGARTARIFIDPKLVIRATRRVEKGMRINSPPWHVMFSVCRPNAREREMIKSGKKDPKHFKFGVVMLDYRK